MLSNLSPCLAGNLFRFASEISKKKGKIAVPFPFFEEEPFTVLFAHYEMRGLFFSFDVTTEALREDVDLIELFIDTRDMKQKNRITRFCHHFVFPIAGKKAYEATRFRGDEIHKLAPEGSLSLEVSKNKKGYTAEIFLSADILTGYDPSLFFRLGFNFRVTSMGGQNHFVKAEGNMETHPMTWGSLKMIS